MSAAVVGADKTFPSMLRCFEASTPKARISRQKDLREIDESNVKKMPASTIREIDESNVKKMPASTMSLILRYACLVSSSSLGTRRPKREKRELTARFY